MPVEEVVTSAKTASEKTRSHAGAVCGNSRDDGTYPVKEGKNNMGGQKPMGLFTVIVAQRDWLGKWGWEMSKTFG